MSTLSSCHPAVYTCFACFCPCVLAGNITSKFHRELPFPCCNYTCCYDYQCGVKGCQTCCITGIGAAVGWPLSPCLACHVARERWKLKLFYKEDDRLKPGTWQSALCWPISLKEQHRFVRDVLEDGSLTFAWDYEQYRDQMQSRPDYLSYTMFVFGPDTAAEKDFLRKLMVRVDHSLPPGIDIPEIRDMQKIHTSTKPLPTENGHIRMLEIWQIPPDRHRAPAIRPFLREASLVLFVLDLNDPDGLQAVKQAYQHHADYLACSKVIVVLKQTAAEPAVEEPGAANKLLDARSSVKTDSSRLEEETVSWARKTTSIWFLITLQHENEIMRINRELSKLLKRENAAKMVVRRSADMSQNQMQGALEVHTSEHGLG